MIELQQVFRFVFVPFLRIQEMIHEIVRPEMSFQVTVALATCHRKAVPGDPLGTLFSVIGVHVVCDLSPPILIFLGDPKDYLRVIPWCASSGRMVELPIFVDRDGWLEHVRSHHDWILQSEIDTYVLLPSCTIPSVQGPLLKSGKVIHRQIPDVERSASGRCGRRG